MEQQLHASTKQVSQNQRIADEANRVAALVASLSIDTDASDAPVVVLKALREIADLAAWAFVSEFEAAAGARIADLLETHQSTIRHFVEPFGRVRHLDAGIVSATALCGMFGRSWDGVVEMRGENEIVDHLAHVLIAANDIENAVLASRIAERAATRAAAGWLH